MRQLHNNRSIAHNNGINEQKLSKIFVLSPLPSLPNLRFFLPAVPLVADEPLLEPLSLLFQRINIFRSLLSVSRAASSDATAARTLVARLHDVPRTFTNRKLHVAAVARDDATFGDDNDGDDDVNARDRRTVHVPTPTPCVLAVSLSRPSSSIEERGSSASIVRIRENAKMAHACYVSNGDFLVRSEIIVTRCGNGVQMQIVFNVTLRLVRE